MEEDERPSPPDVELIECKMCHRPVPVSQTMTLGGRVLCFGCASGWFEDDAEDEE